MQSVQDIIKANSPNRARRASSLLPPAPGPDPSLLRKIGSGTLSGMARVGNLLDLPGSMVRDVIGGENPLDQLLSPTTDQNRLTGRDVMEKYGLLKKNKVGLDTGDVVGFLGEIALDPLTYMTFGAGALTKAGRAARDADLLKYLPDAAKGMGKRTARLNTSLDDLVKAGGKEAQDKISNLVKNKKLDYDSLKNMKLGGAVGLRAPFTDNVLALGKADGLGGKYARTMDKAGDIIGRTAPARKAKQLFTRAAHNFYSKKGQEIGGRYTRLSDEAMVKALGEISGEVDTIQRSGLFDPSLIGDAKAIENSRAAIRYLENPIRNRLPDHLLPVKETLDKFKSISDRELNVMKSAGLDAHELQDDFIDYFHREMFKFDTPTNRSKSGKLINTMNPALLARQSHLKNYKGGTDFLNRISVDPNISGRIFRERTRDLSKDQLGSLRKYVRQKYAGDIDGLGNALADQKVEKAFKNEKITFPAEKFSGKPTKKSKLVIPYGEEFNLAKMTPEEITDLKKLYKVAMNPKRLQTKQLDELVKWAVQLDSRHVEKGIPAFKTNLPELMENYMKWSRQTQDRGNMLVDLVGEGANRVDDIGVNLDHYPTRHAIKLSTVADELSKSGSLNSEAFKGNVINKMMGRKDVDDLVMDGLENGMSEDDLFDVVAESMGIDQDLYDDIMRAADPVRHREPNALDKLTNAFKSHVTIPWPAFHMRNIFSGTVNNLIHGAFKNDYGQSLKEAHELMAGRSPKSLLNIPMIKNAGITDPEEASRLIARKLYEHQIMKGGGGYGLEVLGKETASNPMGGLVGNQPLGPKQIFTPAVDAIKSQGLAPKSANADTLWKRFVDGPLNPLNTEGVRTSKDVFAPAQMGRRGAAYGEGLNRIAPFIGYLRQGVDPMEAMRRVNKSQIDYGNLSRFEKDYMRRLAPFYSFLRGATPMVGSELMTRPGGAMAQTLRAANRARSDEPGLPEHLQQTTAAPLWKTKDGSESYLTGLGLMHEDPLQFVPGTENPMSDMALEVLSRTHPLLKYGIEAATGESLFQQGPHGGRDLRELDPPVGRLLSNITGDEKWLRRTPRAMEHILSNSPAARYISTAKLLTDQRKSIPEIGMNALTGFRTTTLEQANLRKTLEAQLKEALRNYGGKLGSTIYFPDYIKKRMSPAERMEAEKIQQLLRQIQKENRKKMRGGK